MQEKYQRRADYAKDMIRTLNRSINVLVFLRVAVFGLGVALVIFFWSVLWLSLSIGIATAVTFGLLIKIHVAKNEERSYWKAIDEFYENEIKGLNGDWSFASGGEEHHVADHDFAHDIDLFGERSFFQRLNRTSLKGGEELLAARCLSNDSSQIHVLQDANRELRGKEHFIEHFIGYSRINDADVSPKTLKNWLLAFKPFLPSYVRVLSWSFSAISVAVFVLFALGNLSGYLFSSWLILGLLIVGIWLKQITKLNGEINKIVSSIKSYGKLFRLIEDEQFESALLLDLKKKVVNQELISSNVIDDLSQSIDLFNNRNNLIVAFLGNGFLLWDLQTSSRLQKWFVSHGREVTEWLEVLYEFDALISLAVCANNHPAFNYPIVDESLNLSGKNLGHPLIHREQCVTNNVQIEPQNFLIITGANMAGKSTFLRTVSLAILMTNLGLPVFADELRLKPQKLITSMRSTDSLLEDESYFFAELKRLKFIVEKIKEEKYFIVLDEILKGTNSKDKEEGSKKFVRRLVNMGATGIIATHDLGLCTIEKDLPQINNYYFDAEIINDELHFDYKMKDGVCKNMNASFLLKKMDIVSD